MSAIMETIEDSLDSVGLMEGEFAPTKRALLGAAIGYGAVVLAKPSWAYDKDGNPYPWRFTSKGLPTSQTTLMPYWLTALIPAFALGVLI
jgi:hypothetical protein